jgi:hypothetical protein
MNVQVVLMGIADKLAKLPTDAITQGYQQAVTTINAVLSSMDHPDGPAVAQMLREHAAQAASFEAKSNRVQDALVRFASSVPVGALSDDG